MDVIQLTICRISMLGGGSTALATSVAFGLIPHSQIESSCKVNVLKKKEKNLVAFLYDEYG